MDFDVVTESPIVEKAKTFIRKRPLVVIGGVAAVGAGLWLFLRGRGTGIPSLPDTVETPAPEAPKAPEEDSMLEEMLKERLAALERKTGQIQEEVTARVSESLGRELAGWISRLPAVEPVAAKTAPAGEEITTAITALGGVSDIDLVSKQIATTTPAPVAIPVPAVGTKAGGSSRTSSSTSKRYDVVEDDRGIGGVVEAPAAPALPAARAEIYLGQKRTDESTPTPTLPAARADVYLGQKETDIKTAPRPVARADVYLGQKATDAKKDQTPAGGTAKRSRIGGAVE